MAWISPVLSLFYELLASLMESMMQRDDFYWMPPMYQELVFPYPISISAADLRSFTFRDLHEPKIPLILSYFDTRIVRWAAMGKLNSPSSSAS